MIFVRPLGQSIIWRLDLLSKTNFISRSVWIRTAWRPVGVYTVPNIRSRLGNKIDNNKGRYYLLSKEFYEARNEASEQARLRDECFESAKNAYDIGYWANAKRFSDEGKYIFIVSLYMYYGCCQLS